MKNFTPLLVGTLLMIPAFTYGGGDVSPVFLSPVTCELDCKISAPTSPFFSFYVGGGYSYQSLDIATEDIFSSRENSYMLNGGYKLSPFLSIEGRYWRNLSSLDDTHSMIHSNTFAIYVKPSYPILESVEIYTLLGVSFSSISSTGIPHVVDDMNSFSWGIGGSYEVYSTVDVFVDYTQIIGNKPLPSKSDNIDFTFDSVNIGIKYQF